MKKTLLIIALPLMFAACNNEAKDSVEKADSLNREKMDSSDVNPPTIQTDAETTSFLVDAANGGMTEVQLGQMGQQKGTNTEVKSFAAMMVSDHNAANDQVKSFASARNVSLPIAPGDDKQKTMDDLNSKSGAEFDKAYMKVMVDEHEKTISLFEKASGNVNDTEVKNFIDNTLPKLKAHLTSAQDIHKKLK